MNVIAKDFFDNQVVVLDQRDDFLDSDLYQYFKMAYGAAPIFSDKGFIKVVKENGKYSFYEHIFYDWAEDKIPYCYVSIENLELIGTQIQNNEIGKFLSKNGYWGYKNTPEFTNNAIKLLPEFEFTTKGCLNSSKEPTRVFKLGNNIWQNKNPIFKTEVNKSFYHNLDSYMKELVSYSEVLQSLDAYDMNALEWEKSRSMAPHNGVDYRAMINLISYNTDHCKGSRHLMVGTYDWYDTVFYCIRTQDWEPLMDIATERKQSDAFLADTNIAVLVNVFNPKFYHEVEEFKGEGKLYVCTANKSFSAIVDNFDMNW